MRKIHPKQAELEQFMLGRLPSAENREVVRHLLTGCIECRQITTKLWPLPGTDTVADGGGGGENAKGLESRRAFERVLNAVREKEASLDDERSQAPSLFRQLARHPVARQLVLAANSRRYQTWSLCELVLEETLQSCLTEPAKALELGELASVLTDHLSESEYGLALVNDLRARAWTLLGNAHRVNRDFLSAEKAIRCGEEVLREGTGDPLEEGRLQEIKALLLSDQGRSQEAMRMQDRAMRCFKRAGDSHLAGRALVHKAVLCGNANDPERATAILRQALEVLDFEADPRMVLVAKHNLILYLQETGELGEAMSLLRATRPLYARVGKAMDMINLRWMEGQIAQRLNQPQVAELAFLEARKAFVDKGIGFNAAQVCLDLANLYLEQGRTQEVKRLARDMLPIFESQNIHREALAAITVFQRAAESERATGTLVSEVAEYLEKAQANPELVFRSSGSS